MKISNNSLKLKIQKLISELKYDDMYYLDKLTLLTQLLKQPDVGHIIDNKIADWCVDVGFNPRHHCEDGTSWWTCSAK